MFFLIGISYPVCLSLKVIHVLVLLATFKITYLQPPLKLHTGTCSFIPKHLIYIHYMYSWEMEATVHICTQQYLFSLDQFIWLTQNAVWSGFWSTCLLESQKSSVSVTPVHLPRTPGSRGSVASDQQVKSGRPRQALRGPTARANCQNTGRKCLYLNIYKQLMCLTS